MTARDLAALDRSDALVGYLQQPGASAAVCDAGAPGPHPILISPDTWALLARGLAEGRVPPDLWRGCVERALDGASRDRAVPLLNAIVTRYRALIDDAALETSPAMRARLGALQAVYIQRPAGLDADAEVLGPVVGHVRAAFAAGRLRPVAAGFARELLAIVDLQRGLYGGRPVDVALLDDLQARRDQTLLRRFADRLPSPELRDDARSRLVRVRIAASPYAEVRAHAGEVEQAVLRQGQNRVLLDRRMVTSVRLDRQTLDGPVVRLRQDVWHQRVALLGYGAGASPSLLPPVPLRDALRVAVGGLSRPISLCRPARDLDPSPCIAAQDVTLGNSLAYLDGDGALHLAEDAPAREAADLVRDHAFTLSIGVGGGGAVPFAWPVRFERPERLIFANGPHLRVAIVHTDPSLFSFTVSSDQAAYLAVVEAEDLPAFRLTSRGAAGRDGVSGSAGSDGTPGMDGMSASCPSMGGGAGSSGGNGSPGGAGEDGGPGGNGGDVDVAVDCGPTGCAPAVVDLLRAIITSEGGPGGAGGTGGPGGRGGRGGSGGAGTFCPAGDNGGIGSSLSAGSAGMSGSDGMAGSNGSDGSPGRAGQVRITSSPGARAAG
jgi:hypothetical protein